MKKLLAVALGGASGSLVRYLISEVVVSGPISVLIANLAGVGVAGLIAYRLYTSEISKVCWIPGFAGGLTTFSSVAIIYTERNPFESFVYFYGTVILSIALLYYIKPKVRL